MQCRIFDLSDIDELCLNTVIDGVTLSDIINNEQYELCSIIVRENQLESFILSLLESCYDIYKICPWIKSELSSYGIYYNSHKAKSNCQFVIYLRKSPYNYPKNVVNNFYIEDEGRKTYWLSELIKNLKENGIDVTTYPEDINTTNVMEKVSLF